MNETTTKRVWHVSDLSPHPDVILTNGIPDSRAFVLPGNAYSLCDYLNALEACAAVLAPVTELADYYAGEHEFGTEQSAPITAARTALARLRALRDG